MKKDGRCSSLQTVPTPVFRSVPGTWVVGTVGGVEVGDGRPEDGKEGRNRTDLSKTFSGSSGTPVRGVYLSRTLSRHQTDPVLTSPGCVRGGSTTCIPTTSDVEVVHPRLI